VAYQWDAGETGCGQLIDELRRRVESLPPGASIEVIARDAGAPADLPAWCRMTGHPLVSAAHPVYVVKKSKS
jgi:tRNA 2-thiouridine synthesizing protein A